jgi:hypothetical protein
MMSMVDQAWGALRDAGTWRDLLLSRRQPLAQFLRWAAACETGAPHTSLRLEHRGDIGRCRHALPLFDEPWWGVVVYSCFDSTTGAEVAATRFRERMSMEAAATAVGELHFPRSSVQHHRAQSTLTGARLSLVSACEKAETVRDVLLRTGISFEDRFRLLMDVNVERWGRTTCFDALLRAGALGVAGSRYRPEKAYLAGSTGPAAGFERLWGIRVTAETADLCERILHRWTETWTDSAQVVGEPWTGEAYDSADFENALCIFQEPPRAGRPASAAFGQA